MRAPTEFKRLEDVCELFADGDWIETKDQSPSGIRLIQTGNVGNGEFKDRCEKARFVSEETFKRLRCTEIFEGDCLVSRLPDPVGRSCLLPKTRERMITAVDCTIIRFKHDLVEPKYFHYFSQSDGYFRQIEKLTTGATRQRISRGNLGTIVLPRPPLPEQQRVVAILDEFVGGLATAAANVDKNLRNTRELFDSYLNSVLARHDDWQVVALGSVSKRVTVGHVGITSPYYRPAGIIFLRTQNVSKDGLLLDDLKYITREFHEASSKSRVEPGDVLISRVITDRINCALIPPDFEEANCANVILVKPGEQLNSRYLLYYIRSAMAQNELLGRRKGSAQQVVNTQVLKEWKIKLPPVKEQLGLVVELNDLAKQVARLQEGYRQKMQWLLDLKQSLLKQAFSGELASPPSQAVNEAAE